MWHNRKKGRHFDSERSEAAKRPRKSGHGSWRLGLKRAIAPGTGRSLGPTAQRQLVAPIVSTPGSKPVNCASRQYPAQATGR